MRKLDELSLLLAAATLSAVPLTVGYDGGEGNSNDAYVPEHWAMESLVILEESMVMSKLVHRDFNDQVAQYGDIVNTRQPNRFLSGRKTDIDMVDEQDAISRNVQVPLDQHHYVSFIIKDGEASLSFKDLVATYLKPAIQAVGRGVDRSVSGQMHKFIDAPSVGRLGGFSAANARTQLTSALETLRRANVPQEDLRLILSHQSQTSLLNTDLFVAMDQSDDSDALRNAMITRLFNFDIYGANNVPCVSDLDTDVSRGEVTDPQTPGQAPASLAVNITGYEARVGDWVVVAGNDQPQYVTAATVGGGDTTAVTLNVPMKFATAAGAEIKIYRSLTATNAYGVGFSKEVSVSGFTNAPQDGQMIATGSGATRKIYTIIESRTDPTNAANRWILLDRPLEAPITQGDFVFPGVAGCFNLAFHRNAIAFVNRPLATPPPSAGVMSAVAEYNDLSIRITMQYDSKCQGTRVTCDLLSGVALLDKEMACLFYG